MKLNDGDSYAPLLKWADKSAEEFISFGIDHIVWPGELNMSAVEEGWLLLKDSVLNGGYAVPIRASGRDGHAFQWFQSLYTTLFPAAEIFPDPINNKLPGKTLRQLTENSGKGHLTNYQVSHIFERSKNPLLFNCLWNVAYIPKIFDPLTGHESKGTLNTEFQLALRQRHAKLYGDLIEDYNLLVANRDLEGRTAEWLNSWTPEADASTRKIAAFKKNATEQVSGLPLYPM